MGKGSLVFLKYIFQYSFSSTPSPCSSVGVSFNILLVILILVLLSSIFSLIGVSIFLLRGINFFIDRGCLSPPCVYYLIFMLLFIFYVIIKHCYYQCSSHRARWDPYRFLPCTVRLYTVKHSKYRYFGQTRHFLCAVLSLCSRFLLTFLCILQVSLYLFLNL